MRNTILNLGKALNKAEQTLIKGGSDDGPCVNYDTFTKTSSRGPCDPNSIHSVPIKD